MLKKSQRVIALAVAVTLTACADQPTQVRPAIRSTEVSRLFVPVSGTYQKVVMGTSTTCALRSDGVIACWGTNHIGQGPPTKSAATGVFTTLSLDFWHGCALRSDGVIECWGLNDDNQAPPVVSPPGGTLFVAMAVGTSHSCAVRTDGAIQCWGDNTFGQAPPVRPAASGTFVAVSAWSANTCGLNSNGGIECFGFNAGDPRPVNITPSTGSFVKLVKGRKCGIRNDGVIECGLGQGNLLPGTFIDYETDTFHECAINTNGVAQCQLFEGIDRGQAPATRSATTGSFVQVAVGADHTCALRSDGAIECWGAFFHGAYDKVLPTATFTAPPSVIVGQPVALALTGAQVPGYSATFTYAFNCGGGWDFSPPPSSSSTASCATTTVGMRTVGGKVFDHHGDSATYSATVTIKSAEQWTSDLRAEISSAPLAPDIRKALQTKLDAALAAIAKGKTAGACGALKDFINQVNAQRGKAIPEATADDWILAAQQLQVALGC